MSEVIRSGAGDRYELVEPIARGAMGAVFRARSAGREVAVKQLLERGQLPSFPERLRRDLFQGGACAAPARLAQARELVERSHEDDVQAVGGLALPEQPLARLHPDRCGPARHLRSELRVQVGE